MEKFLSKDFLFLLFLALILMIVHEFGHWISYRILGYQAVVRKSLLVPGIDPKETIQVTKYQGLFIALNGFIVSFLVIIVPCYLLSYRYWNVLLIGGLFGASLDFIWAFTMIFQSTIVIKARN